MVKVEVLAEALVFDVLWLVVILVGDELWVEVVGSLAGSSQSRACAGGIHHVPAEVPLADVAGLVARSFEKLGQVVWRPSIGARAGHGCG